MVTVGKDGAGAAQVHLGMRSGLVGTYPSTNHVIPAGMCNTNGTDVGPRVGETRIPSHYLVTAMKCEFIEEWFDEKELEENKRLDWKTLVERSWKERAGHGWEEPVLTGVAFDLLNLRPEVCAATFATARKSRLNWEFDSVGFSGCLKTAREIEPIEIVQSGAAALWLLEQSPAGPRAGAART